MKKGHSGKDTNLKSPSPNIATSLEAQKRKLGYHGTKSKTRNCLMCSYSKFRRSSGGSIIHNSMTCTQCQFPIGEYGICRNWKEKRQLDKSDYLSALGIDNILDGVN